MATDYRTTYLNTLDSTTRYRYEQAAREGAALRGELGKEAQLIAMSAQYMQLRAQGKVDEARAIRAAAALLMGRN